MLGKCFLLTHGHKENVKVSLDKLKAISIQKKADIVLYGHTHIAHYEEYNGIKFLCPGTCRPHYIQQSTFGTVEFNKGNVLVYHSPYIQ
jgi:putative phosphoesterase